MGREQRLLGMVSLLAGLALIFPGVGHARTAARMSWAHPITIDRDENATPMGVTCPSAGLCLAYDDAGRVLVSLHPTGGASSWKVRQVDPASWALEGISCPSKSLCVVYNKQGTIFASTNPGASRWVRMAADHDGLNSLSCPSVSLCVGVDDAGNAIASTGPGRRGSWKIAWLGDTSPTPGCEHYQVDPCTERSLRDVSCTAPALCVALDQARNGSPPRTLREAHPRGTLCLPKLSTAIAPYRVSLARLGLSAQASTAGEILSSPSSQSTASLPGGLPASIPAACLLDLTPWIPPTC